MGSAKCPLGCTCGRHAGPRISRACEPGCTCKKHDSSGRPRTTDVDWNDPEARKAYNRQKANERYAANPEPQREAQRRYRSANPGRRGGKPTPREWHIKSTYGITPERMAQLALEQNGLCYLCGDPLDFTARGAAAKSAVNVDHDHACCPGRRSCGKCIRGLAHGQCNTAVGLLGDDPERMRRVADNLEAANRRLRNPPDQG